MMTRNEATKATLEELTDELAAAGWDSTQESREEALAAVLRLLDEVDSVTAREVTTRAKVFGRMQDARCRVEPDGGVLVYDDVAGHYTRCHSLGPSAIRRIRKLAE